LYDFRGSHHEYQLNFVTEYGNSTDIFETEACNEMRDAEVLAKKEGAAEMVSAASEFAAANGAKLRTYSAYSTPSFGGGFQLNLYSFPQCFRLSIHIF